MDREKVACVIVGVIALAGMFVAGLYFPSSSSSSDTRDRTIGELRKQLADVEEKLKAEATPQAELVELMRSKEAYHKREVLELKQQLVRQAQLMEELRVDPCLAGLQSRLQDAALRFEKVEQRFKALDARLRGMQDEIDSKASRGHTHIR